MNQNKLIVSNWKMNLKLSDSRKLVEKIIKSSKIIKPHIKKIICPQFLLIPHVSDLIKKTKIYPTSLRKNLHLNYNLSYKDKTFSRHLLVYRVCN